MNFLRDTSLDFRGIPAGQGLHSIHPYPAMFHFLLVRKFLKELSREGDLILDPDCKGENHSYIYGKGIEAVGIDTKARGKKLRSSKLSKY
ncbi:hypothetical protein [Thermocrinis sp.]|jgi:hypothetical protein|uniref:hypothetical protein n=1 Tax=Thermocrinis sp. TaxID=2024383 RepID=UPI003C09DE92